MARLPALARIGPDEHHPAVAEPDLSHLHRHGDPGDQRHLVAPVELIGLARRKAQRHKGRRRRGRTLPPPRRRVPAHRVIAARVAKPAQFLEDVDERQTFPAGPGCVRRQKPVQLVPPGPDLRLRLNLPLVFEVRGTGSQDLPDRIAGNIQLPADLLDRPTPHIELAAYPRDRVHALHPPPPVQKTRTGSAASNGRGGQFWTPIPQLRGSTFHAKPQGDGLFGCKRHYFCDIRE